MVQKQTGVSPAVPVAKGKANLDNENNVVMLAGGVQAKLVPVSASLIDEVTSKVKDPQIPMWHNPEKDRDEPNPNDPIYLAAVAEVGKARSTAAIDAIVMFGVDLIDGLPQDDKWLKKLRYMEKRGSLDLSSYDLDDELDKEFLYKRFVGVGIDVINEISKISGVSGEDVEDAERSFPGDEER
jgi:hypothetical protein